MLELVASDPPQTLLVVWTTAPLVRMGPLVQIVLQNSIMTKLLLLAKPAMPHVPILAMDQLLINAVKKIASIVLTRPNV